MGIAIVVCSIIERRIQIQSEKEKERWGEGGVDG
jgi:hypothetical protein